MYFVIFIKKYLGELKTWGVWNDWGTWNLGFGVFLGVKTDAVY